MQVERQDTATEGFGIATRSFVLVCLCSLWQHMAGIPNDTCQPVLQASAAPVVQSAFAVVEESAESLRTGALALLTQVLATFVGVSDPEDEGAEVMDVFAAPYVTALKMCLGKRAAGPSVAQAATLAGHALVSGMLHQDKHSCEVRNAVSTRCRLLTKIKLHPNLAS
jgi:hypothetical protein